MEEVEERTLSISCDSCLSCGFSEGDDGIFYCDCCGSLTPDIIDTRIADEHFVEKVSDARALMYLSRNSPQRPEDVSDDETSSQYESLARLSPHRDMNTPEEEADDHDDTSACSNIPAAFYVLQWHSHFTQFPKLPTTCCQNSFPTPSTNGNPRQRSLSLPCPCTIKKRSHHAAADLAMELALEVERICVQRKRKDETMGKTKGILFYKIREHFGLTEAEMWRRWSKMDQEEEVLGFIPRLPVDLLRAEEAD